MGAGVTKLKWRTKLNVKIIFTQVGKTTTTSKTCYVNRFRKKAGFVETITSLWYRQPAENLTEGEWKSYTNRLSCLSSPHVTVDWGLGMTMDTMWVAEKNKCGGTISPACALHLQFVTKFVFERDGLIPGAYKNIIVFPIIMSVSCWVVPCTTVYITSMYDFPEAL